MSDAVPASRPAEIRALTGLRGVAALYVVLFHSRCVGDISSATAALFAHGYVAVDLFFVLSGFVMAMTAAPLFETKVRLENFRYFLGLRLARIYPLFALMTVLTFGLVRNGERSPADLVFNLLLVHSWGLATTIIATGWSISAEWAAYLVFPWLSRLANRVTPWLSAVLVAAIFAGLAAIAYGPSVLAGGAGAEHAGPLNISSPNGPGALIRCLGEFILGLLAWRWRRLVPSAAALPVLAVALGLVCWPGSDLLLVAAFALLIMSLSHDRGLVARALGSAVPHYLGDVSYALYLGHVLMALIVAGGLDSWNAGWPQVVRVGLLVALSLGFAALLHHGLEIRARRTLRRWLAATAIPAAAPVS